MDAIEKRARELLATEYDKIGGWFAAECIRNSDARWPATPSLNAIIAALTPPEGYVLAPVAWTSEMRGAFVNKTQGGMRNLDDGYAAMLAARPEVP